METHIFFSVFCLCFTLFCFVFLLLRWMFETNFLCASQFQFKSRILKDNFREENVIWIKKIYICIYITNTRQYGGNQCRRHVRLQTTEQTQRSWNSLLHKVPSATPRGVLVRYMKSLQNVPQLIKAFVQHIILIVSWKMTVILMFFEAKMLFWLTAFNAWKSIWCICEDTYQNSTEITKLRNGNQAI